MIFVEQAVNTAERKDENADNSPRAPRGQRAKSKQRSPRQYRVGNGMKYFVLPVIIGEA